MKNAKLAIIILAIIILLGGSFYAYNSLSNKQTIARESESINPSDETQNSKIKAPDFKVYDKDNNEVFLSDFVGQPIVINFWASWCPPCRAEMDNFQKASENYSKNGVKFFMINSTDGDKETIQTATQYFKDNSYNMDIYFDLDFDASYKYNARSLPTSFFINPEGNIAMYHSGIMSEKMLSNSIDSILESDVD